MKKLMLTLALGSVLSVGTVAAQPYPQYTPPGMYGSRAMQPPQMAEPRTISAAAMTVQQGMGKLLDFLSGSEPPPLDELKRFLHQEIAPYFDFEYMAQAAAGPLWRDMQEAQRTALAGQIEQSFLRILTQRLVAYDNQRFEPLADRMSSDGQVATVSVAVVGAQGYPSRLDFRLYQGESGWKSYDVLANGQSAVAHFRREFRQMMYQPYGRGMRHRHGYGHQAPGSMRDYPRPLAPTSG
jgi:phospholipid transport system substrate-binding protein